MVKHQHHPKKFAESTPIHQWMDGFDIRKSVVTTQDVLFRIGYFAAEAPIDAAANLRESISNFDIKKVENMVFSPHEHAQDLFMAVQRKEERPEKLHDLLYFQNASPDYVTADGETAMHQACYHDNAVAVKLFLEVGTSSVFFRDMLEATPLHYAAENNCNGSRKCIAMEIVAALLRELDGKAPATRVLGGNMAMATTPNVLALKHKKADLQAEFEVTREKDTEKRTSLHEQIDDIDHQIRVLQTFAVKLRRLYETLLSHIRRHRMHEVSSVIDQICHELHIPMTPRLDSNHKHIEKPVVRKPVQKRPSKFSMLTRQEQETTVDIDMDYLLHGPTRPQKQKHKAKHKSKPATTAVTSGAYLNGKVQTRASQKR